MKLIHLSDLHLGKREREFSLIEDQHYILTQILDIIDDEAPQGVILAGDIYDKPVPPAEAVELFDDFLVQLAKRKLQVFAISGNHDSPERIAFGGRIMGLSGVHLSPVYDGKVEPISLTDEFGTVNVYLLPFVKPAHVRPCFQEDGITSYTDAIRAAVAHMDVNPSERNVLVTHQFVTGAERSESEELSVGGADNVDASAFDGFDYVALGHLHGPQNVGDPRIRYCGTPLKYSFSEARQQKSVSVVVLGPKGDLDVRTVPLHPLRDMVELKGAYMELTAKSFYDGKTWPQDYVHITLTDEEDVPNAIATLRVVYPYLMKLDYDNARTRKNQEVGVAEDVERKSPLELFAEFYMKRNNQPMTPEQQAYAQRLIEKVWEDEK